MLAANPNEATIAATAIVSPMTALRTGVAERPCPGSRASLAPAPAEAGSGSRAIHAASAERRTDPWYSTAPSGPVRADASRRAGITTLRIVVRAIMTTPRRTANPSIRTPTAGSMVRDTPIGNNGDRAIAPATAIAAPATRDDDRGQSGGPHDLRAGHPDRAQHRRVDRAERRAPNEELSEHHDAGDGGERGEHAQDDRGQVRRSLHEHTLDRHVEDERLRFHRVDRREERRERGEVTLQLEHARIAHPRLPAPRIDEPGSCPDPGLVARRLPEAEDPPRDANRDRHDCPRSLRRADPCLPPSASASPVTTVSPIAGRGPPLRAGSS